MIKIVYDSDEYGNELDKIGTIHYDATISDETTGYDVIDAIVKVMKVAEYHPDTIKRALESALEGLEPDEEVEMPEEEEVI